MRNTTQTHYIAILQNLFVLHKSSLRSVFGMTCFPATKVKLKLLFCTSPEFHPRIGPILVVDAFPSVLALCLDEGHFPSYRPDTSIICPCLERYCRRMIAPVQSYAAALVLEGVWLGKSACVCTDFCFLLLSHHFLLAIEGLSLSEAAWMHSMMISWFLYISEGC